jgi:hypothetical protein
VSEPPRRRPRIPRPPTHPRARADHAAIDRLADELLPALIAKLGASGLGELEVREGDWRSASAGRSRQPRAAGPRAGAQRAGPGHGRQPVPGGGRRRPGRTHRSPPEIPRPTARARGRDPGARSRRLPAVGIYRPRRTSRRRSRPRRGPARVVDMLGVPQEVVAPSTGSSGRHASSRPGEAVEYGQELVVDRVPKAADAPERGGLMFRKILIANRGEIALRILRACRTLGIEAVVAYSEADRESLPVQLADEAICIGPADARGRISRPRPCISAAPRHRLRRDPSRLRLPVRGRRLRRASCGPRPDLHRAAGRGARALRQQGGHAPAAGRARPADDPGLRACCATTPRARAEAERIGYPVLIKPSAGGGGKGMRMVRSPRELEPALKVCRSEARAAFGDDSLYLEKWLEDNRHVEVQVVVDRYGNGVHLGERDCSVQRRHQKIIEEAPTPGPRPGGPRGARERPPSAAVVAAGYENVGTLEFLVDRDGQLLLHRDQLPDPGRAPGHGDADRHRPRGHPDPDRRRRAARLHPGGRRACAATRSSSASTPRTRSTTSGPGRHGRALHAPGRPGRPDGQPPVQRLRGPAVLRFAPRQAHRLGPDRARRSPAAGRRSTSSWSRAS